MTSISLKNKHLLFSGTYSEEQNGFVKKFLMGVFVPMVIVIFLSGCSDSLPDGLPDNIPAAGECSVCHGNGRTVSGAVSFTSSTDLTCRSCHGYYTNPSALSGRHSKHISEDVTCYTCHMTVVNNSDAIIDKTAHINGSVNVSLTTGTFNASTKTCSSNDCHESEDWYD